MTGGVNMKKKLIAALTSAAMVATMVPATAFAGTAVVTAGANQKPAATAKAATANGAFYANITLPSEVQLSKSEAAKKYVEAGKAVGLDRALNQGITASMGEDGVLYLKGTVPYIEDFSWYAGDSATSDGNFLMLSLEVEDGNTSDEFTDWGYTIYSENTDPKSTLGFDRGSINGKTSRTTVVRLDEDSQTRAQEYKFYYGTTDLDFGEAGAVISAENQGNPVTVKVDRSALDLQTKEEYEAERDAALLKNARDLINAASANPTQENVDAAQKAYDACGTELQNDLIKDGTYDKLQAAIKALAEAGYAEDAKSVIDQIAKLPPQIVDKEDIAAVGAARGAYDALGEKENGAEIQKAVTNYTNLTDAEAAVKAVEAIINIGTVDASNFDSQAVADKITKAKNAYDELTNNQRSLVGNYQTYTSAVATVEDFTQEIADADVVFGELAALNKAEPEATQEWVDKAQAAVDKAEEILKGWGDDERDDLLGKLTKGTKTDLDDVKAKIEKMETEINNKAEADAIIAKIKAIPSTVGIDDMATVKAAELAYESVGTVSDLVVTTYSITEDNKEAIKALVDEAFANGGDSVIEKAKQDLKTAVDEATVEEVAAAYKAVADAIPASPRPADQEAVNVAADLQKDLQNWKEALGVNETYLAAVQTVTNAQTTIDNINKVNEAAFAKVQTLVQSFFDKNKMKPIKATDRPEVEAARAAYDALTEEQKALDTKDVKALANQTVKEALEAVEKKLAEVEAERPNAEAAEALVLAIKELLPTEELTIDDANRVKAVKAQFDAANETVQTLLSNSGTYNVKNGDQTVTAKEALNAAIAKIDKLVAEDMVKQIEALKAPAEGADKAAIEEAVNAAKAVRDAYDALTKEQQAQVTNLSALEAVEDSISDAKVAYVNAQLEEAAKIDTDNMDADGIAALNAAKDLMENWLTEEEATKLNADTLKAFNDTYSKYEEATQNLSKAKVSGITEKTYTGSAITQNLTVTDMAGKTIAAENYHVTYSNNVNAGTATILITGENGYTGRLTAEFKINPASLTGAAITVANQTYTGSALKPAVTVKVGDNTIAAENYDVAYTNNINAGTATVTITGKDNYAGTASKTFTIAKASISKASVTGVANRYYTGKARTQTGLKVTVAGKALSASNYSVKYANNKNVGKATLTITGQGNYTGTITKTFIVKPRKVSNVKVTKGKKRVTVRYKKQNGARYQIYYKKAGTKAKTVKTAAVKRTIKKLKSGKTYTIKVRAYKKIGSKTYYGKYSKAKKVRVR